MSKKLIAGLGTVAALGIAALPLAGVFAVVNDSAETIVRVKVPEAVECTSISGTDADFIWFGEVAPGVTQTKGLTVSGASNAAAGFTIVGTAYDLTSGTLVGAEDARDSVFTADTTGAQTIGYNKSTAADGKWWLTTSDANVDIATDANTITLNGAGQATRDFTMTAGVRPAITNKPGIYQGHINWVCSVITNP